MARTCVAALAVLGLFLARPVQAEDFAGAKLVSVARGSIAFEHEGKNYKLGVALSLKIMDDKGELQDPITGTRFLAPGNIVDIKTETDKKTKKRQIVEIKFVSGTVGDLPKTPEKPDLRPDPNYKGTPIEGGETRDPYWQRYLPTAKVGDFIEYSFGNSGSPGRQEVMEVGKDYVIVAKVSYILNKRQEDRRKVKLPSGGATASQGLPGKKPSAKDTEELEVAGRKLTCTVEKDKGKPIRWMCADVPLDGKVKEDLRNFKYLLTNFGRGE
jgi:hypothetical protein